MNTITRRYCPDCSAERKGITYDGLPVQFIGGVFPHEEDCSGDGTFWVQVYEGEDLDAPSPAV